MDTTRGAGAVAENLPVITGLGVIAPTGIGKNAHWQATIAGKSGIGQITRFDPAKYPVKVAGEVPGYAAKGRVPGRLIPQTDHWTHMGLSAAEDALADAGVDPPELPEFEMAVVTASSSGGTEFGQKEIERLWSSGPQFVGAYQSIAWFYAATTGQISIRHGMRGPCGVIACEQAGGLDTLGQARRLLAGDIRLVVAGGTDASLCPYGLSAQLSTGRLSERDDPTGAYLPFDADASGYVPGEGGAILITERAGDAARRGAHVYGSVVGYAATFDPPPGSPRPPGLRRAIEQALADAGVTPPEIDVVFADATGTPAADRAESEAISAVFGAGAVPVTAPKTLTGRLYGGGAALDVATALLAMGEGVIPATIGTTQLADGIDLDIVLDRPRPTVLRTALVVARGYGGFNAAVVLRGPANES
jgi:act minimal PKS chain-length factor (CLF/KS beta)